MRACAQAPLLTRTMLAIVPREPHTARPTRGRHGLPATRELQVSRWHTATIDAGSRHLPAGRHTPCTPPRGLRGGQWHGRTPRLRQQHRAVGCVQGVQGHACGGAPWQSLHVNTLPQHAARSLHRRLVSAEYHVSKQRLQQLTEGVRTCSACSPWHLMAAACQCQRKHNSSAWGCGRTWRVGARAAASTASASPEAAGVLVADACRSSQGRIISSCRT